MINTFIVTVACCTILLLAWWALDRIEDANSAARARLAHDVRVRQRMHAVVMMADRRRP